MSLQVVQMTEERLRELLTKASELGAHMAMRAAGLPIKEFYTATELSRRHGRRLVQSLINDGKLKPYRFPDNEKTKRVVYRETELLSQIN